MTNYLTSVGIQQVSITIAAGNTTGTATITAVGSGAFPVFQGITSNDTLRLVATAARVEVTNSTTVTATRGAAFSTDTVTVNAVIIDADPTNLVKSVQSGTISLSTIQSSNTASISAVTNANTAVLFLGTSDTTASSAAASYRASVSLSGTTVTASRGATGTAISVGYCAVEFQGSALNSAVQNIAFSNSSGVGATANQAITSISVNNTFLGYGGATQSSGNPTSGYMYAQLTSSTNISFTWNTASITTRTSNICVVEFVSGVLAQIAQRGTIALAAATIATATITSAATANTFVNYLGNSSAGTGTGDGSDFQVTQTNATTVTLSSGVSDTGTGSYEAITFQPFSGGGATQGLFMQSLLNGLQVGGPFFANPIG